MLKARFIFPHIYQLKWTPSDEKWRKPFSFTDGKNVRIDHGLVAVDTILGWVLNGSFNPDDKKSSSVNCISTHVLKVECVKNDSHHTLMDSMERFWEVESAKLLPKTKEFDSHSFLNKIH